MESCTGSITLEEILRVYGQISAYLQGRYEESREDVWQEAQGRAEEVAQMFQLPEGMPDADELAAEDEIDTLGPYYYGYPEPTGKDFLHPFGGNPQLCLDEA